MDLTCILDEETSELYTQFKKYLAKKRDGKGVTDSEAIRILLNEVGFPTWYDTGDGK